MATTSELTEELKQRVRELVCQVLEIDIDELGEQDRFKDDFGVDSMREIEILGALEAGLRVRIDRTGLPRMTHLAGVWSVVAEELGRRPDGAGAA